MERTPAILQELVSVQLNAKIGIYNVLLERIAYGSNQVQVTWQNAQMDTGTVLAPIQTSETPIWEDSIFNLSDLIFYLSGITPMKVRRSKINPESPLVRLSFRDIMWYCYLEQDHLDSSFYKLEDTFRKLKSRDVMRFIVGYFTENLNDLEISLDEIKQNRIGKIEAIRQVRNFLKQFGYESEIEICAEAEKVRNQLEVAKIEQADSRKEFSTDTHFADDLRKQLIGLIEIVDRETKTLNDLIEQISSHEALKAELMSMKFKVARAHSASAILSNVSFEKCPSCGNEISAHINEPEKCILCGNKTENLTEQISTQMEIVRKDLVSRLDEITDAIKRKKRAFRKQEILVNNLLINKLHLDQRLSEELKVYDSMYMSRSRELENRVATLVERHKGLCPVPLLMDSRNT